MKVLDIKNVHRRINDGAWVDSLPNLPGVAVKVRAMFNADYTKRLNQLSSKLTMEERQDEAVQELIDRQLMVETVLLDWKGIEDLPYTRANAKMVFEDPSFGVFRQAITYAATIVAREGKDRVEEDLKNSSASLNGKSRGVKAANAGTPNLKRGARSRRATSRHERA